MSHYRALGLESWSERNTFSPAVRCGDFIYFAGLTAADHNRQIVGEGDIVLQTRVIFQKIERLLNEAGASFANIVETTEFFVWSEDYRKTADVRRQYLTHPFPAATGIPVERLIHPKALIEIRAVAYLGTTT
jgi:aminoacrylate peracid reductase